MNEIETNNELKVIDFIDLWNKIAKKKKIFFYTIPFAFVLSCVFILLVPRYYSTEIKLAPEIDNNMNGGTLSSIASSFGFDLGDMQTSDAISPLLYPELMEDNKFVTELFNIKVESHDKEIKTTYFDYLSKYQKQSPWGATLSFIKNLFASKDAGNTTSKQLDPYYLSKREDKVAKILRGKISINVDKKTTIISIAVEDQDPLICKTVADSVKSKLQDFITNYRTNKARIDLEYYKKLTADSKKEYERARQLYGSYADANTDVILQSFRSKQEDLENDMQLKYNAYSTLSTQLQAAKARVQERTPAFTLIKGAAVPIKPSGPKRMIFVAFMTLLTFIFTSVYAIYKP